VHVHVRVCVLVRMTCMLVSSLSKDCRQQGILCDQVGSYKLTLAKRVHPKSLENMGRVLTNNLRKQTKAKRVR